MTTAPQFTWAKNLFQGVAGPEGPAGPAGPENLTSVSTLAAYRAAPAPADGATVIIINPPLALVYSATAGAGVADDGLNFIKRAGVSTGSPGVAANVATRRGRLNTQELGWLPSNDAATNDAAITFILAHYTYIETTVPGDYKTNGITITGPIDWKCPHASTATTGVRLVPNGNQDYILRVGASTYTGLVRNVNITNMQIYGTVDGTSPVQQANDGLQINECYVGHFASMTATYCKRYNEYVSSHGTYFITTRQFQSKYAGFTGGYVGAAPAAVGIFYGNEAGEPANSGGVVFESCTDYASVVGTRIVNAPYCSLKNHDCEQAAALGGTGNALEIQASTVHLEHFYGEVLSSVAPWYNVASGANNNLVTVSVTQGSIVTADGGNISVPYVDQSSTLQIRGGNQLDNNTSPLTGRVQLFGRTSDQGNNFGPPNTAGFPDHNDTFNVGAEYSDGNGNVWVNTVWGAGDNGARFIPKNDRIICQLDLSSSGSIATLFQAQRDFILTGATVYITETITGCPTLVLFSAAGAAATILDIVNTAASLNAGTVVTAAQNVSGSAKLKNGGTILLDSSSALYHNNVNNFVALYAPGSTAPKGKMTIVLDGYTVNRGQLAAPEVAKLVKSLLNDSNAGFGSAESLSTSGVNVTGWTWETGETFVSYNANYFNAITVPRGAGVIAQPPTANPAITAASNVINSLDCNNGHVYKTICALVGAPTGPFSANAVAADAFHGATGFLSGVSGMSNLFAGSGIVNYINARQTSTVAAVHNGMCVLSSVYAANVSGGLSLMGYYAGARAWQQAPVVSMVASTVAANYQQVAAIANILMQYSGY